MISILFAFWMFVVLFGLIGAMRGWAKELLVIFSVVLALFLIYVLESFTQFMVPFEEVLGQVENLSPENTELLIPCLSPVQDELKIQFWSRASIVAILAFFGYQTPRLAVVAGKSPQGKGPGCAAGSSLGFGQRIFYHGNPLVVYGSCSLSIWPGDYASSTWYTAGRCGAKCIKVFPAGFC